MQSQHFRQHLIVGRNDVAVDEALQAARLVAELDQKPVGFAHASHVVPRAAEHVGAVPDEHGKDDRDRGIERGDREQTPPYRQHPQQGLRGDIDGAPRPGERGQLVLECDQIEAHWTWRIRSINCRASSSVITLE